jgi:hypothetical protein
MKADTEPLPGIPRDYAIVLPDSWCQIPLEPGSRERAIRELVIKQFAGQGSVPERKAQLRRILAERAEAAWRAGGIELYLSLLASGSLPLAASLVIRMVPPPSAGSLSPEELVATYGTEGRPAEIRKLGAGAAVFTQPQPGSLDVHVQVPDSGAWLLLAFATPVEALAEPMLALFTAIAQTLRWT